MATTLGLNVQFTASANGMAKGLSQVDRQLKQLGSQAAAAASLFDQFASSSAAAAAAQLQTATDLAFLNSAFKTGQISAEQYAAELRGIVSAAQTSAAAFAEGARVTGQVATAEEKRATALTRLGELLKLGAIDQQTYDRAAADASGANAEAARAEEARAKALARAAAITQANLTPQQRYDQEVQELNSHLQAGRITQDTYNTALAKAKQSFDRAAASAAKYDAAADNAGTGNTLAFNELSGILSALPGPLGSVAGRISGLASAGEGLGRVFSGGLSQGFSGVAASAAGLVNPLTIGVGAFAAFGVAANAVVQGLVALEDRVERLGFAAEQLGASFQTVQVLEEAARRTGVSFDTLTTGLQKFAVKLNEARDKSSGAAKALEQLGISQQELAGLTLPQAAERVATALGQIRDPAQRAALQLALLGQSGDGLRRAFASIDDADAALSRFSARISDIDKERIDQLGTAFDNVKTAVEGLGVNLLVPFAGLVEGVANAVAESLQKVTAFTSAIGATAGPALDFLGDTLPQAVADTTVQLLPFGNVLSGIANTFEFFGFGASEAASGVGDIAIEAETAADGADGLAAAFDRTRVALNSAVDQSAKFGQAGLSAAYEYQEALRRLQEQAEAGILNETAYQREVDRATAAYNDRIDSIRQARAEEDRTAEAAQRAADAAIEADRRRADAAIERMRIEADFGGDSERARAAENVLAIENEIRSVAEQSRQAGRNANIEAQQAANERLDLLETARQREQDIADGSARAREEAEKKAQQAADERLQREEQRRREILSLEERYQDRMADIQSDRLEELSRLSQEQLTISDVRTAEGAAQFLALATGREDPAVAEARKQVQELQKIQREIRELRNQPVDILGA